MRNSIDHYSPGMGYLTTICDLILLNLFFMLSCLPVFTVGAAVCGMCRVTGKLVRGEEGPVWRTYWAGFRENFKRATLFWVLTLGLFALIGLDWWVLPVMLPAFYQVPRAILAMGALFACAWLCWLFPVMTRFVCTAKQAAKNAALLAIGHFPTSLCLLALHGVLPGIALISELAFLYAACMYLICGFALTNLTASYLLSKILLRYESK